MVFDADFSCALMLFQRANASSFSQLASEDGYFTFDDVLNDVSEKIVRRHPHVFGDATAGNEEEALARWNSIKAQEKSAQKTTVYFR